MNQENIINEEQAEHDKYVKYFIYTLILTTIFILSVVLYLKYNSNYLYDLIKKYFQTKSYCKFL